LKASAKVGAFFLADPAVRCKSSLQKLFFSDDAGFRWSPCQSQKTAPLQLRALRCHPGQAHRK
jgi:hypothetical protein